MRDKGIFKDRKAINIFLIIIIMIMILGTIFVYINLVQYKLGLNADIAAEGLLAKVIWESGEWIPEEWYFSSESKLISVTNLASIFYGMTGNMSVSMGIGCIIGMLFIIFSLQSLCKELGLGITQNLLFVFLIILLPNSKSQLELLYLFAAYYAFHIGLYFITLTFYLKLLKGTKVKKYQIVILGLLHFMLGTQGVRGILMITGPLMVVEVIRRIYLLYRKVEWKKEDNFITGLVVSLNIFGFLGGLIPISVGYPLSRNIRKAPQKFFEVVMPDFFNTFDWMNISVVEKIVFIACLLLVIYLSIFIVLKGLKKQNITGYEWAYLNLVVSVFLTIAALTFTTVESSSRYFVVIFFAIAMAIVSLWNEKSKIVKYAISIIMVAILAGNCYRVYYPMVTNKSFENNEYTQIGNYLIQEGYENAYTIFEHANTITVMNDGKIQVSAVASLSNMEVCKWLSSKKWYVPNVPKESKTAYIVSDYGLEEFNQFLEEHQEDVEFKVKIGIFNIYGSDYNYSKLTE